MSSSRFRSPTPQSSRTGMVAGSSTPSLARTSSVTQTTGPTLVLQLFFYVYDVDLSFADLLHNACEVDAEFSPSQYETSPDGIFTVEIKNSDKLRMEDLHRMKVEFSGTYIPFN